jgi:hypothetical protein
MKAVTSFLFAAALLGSLTSLEAAPPSKQTAPAAAKTLRVKADFEQIQTGEKIALVCKECDSVSVQTVANKDDVMKHCAEGQTITCPSCKTIGKVVKHGPSGKQGRHLETVIVNQDGKECMFVAKLPE